MQKTKLCLASLLLCAIASNLRAAEQTEFESTLTKVGQQVPDIGWVTLDGQKFDAKTTHGKVVLINFFATWCGPCMQEMPHLQKDVLEKFKGKDFVMVAIGREHNDAELKEFQKKRGFTIPIAADPERKIYGRFATQYIPRNYVIGADGKIAFQSVGYNEGEFKKMLDIISTELKKVGAKS
jgi:thiol-disulfide isomerase/thioredoxin